MKNQEPLISIVIPAFNEREYMADTLQSVKNQTYDRLEIIVVANGCEDDTAKIARESASLVIETPIQGISYAKNVGFSNSNGDVCAFMDADSRMKDDLAEKVCQSLADGYDCGKAKIRPLDDDRLRGQIFCLYSEALSRITKYVSWIDSGAGAFTYATRDLLEQVKEDKELFKTKLKVMEDVDFLIRLKKKGNYKFITESCLYTSMRRFMEEGYLKCWVEDTIHVMSPEGKDRKRWEKQVD